MSQIYFEDISVDDELEPLDQFPTEDKAMEFFGRDNPTNPAFGDAEAGRRMGFGGALVPGLLKLSWITGYVGAWAGSEANLRSVRVAFRRPDIAGKPLISGTGGVDVAVNFTGGDSWTPTLRCVTRAGRVLTCGATAGYDVHTDLRYLWTYEQQVLGSNGWRNEDLLALLELGASGLMRPVISQVLPLQKTAEAEQQMEDRKIFGKVLIKP